LKIEIHSYQSKFKDVVREEANKNKTDHRTMGYAKEPAPQPNSFLKKHEKEFVLPERKSMFFQPMPTHWLRVSSYNTYFIVLKQNQL
jgi:hypothetical protein